MGLFGKKKTSMQRILSMKDNTDFVIALEEHLDEKCDYGDEMDALTREERVFYVTQQVEMEVNNGGFDQFFCNSSGQFAGEMVDAFQAIGAVKTAAICQRVLDAIGTEVPVDGDERDTLMESLESDELTEAFEACDAAFYEYEEDLTALCRRYVAEHSEAFE